MARSTIGVRAAAVVTWRTLAALLSTTLLAAGLAVPGQAVSQAWPVDAAHPYSDPEWLPLQSPAVVSCARTNCPGPFHGYWALDFVGDLGDPIHAAGAGVLHIGAQDTTCETSATSNDSEGTWVWIDHGAGLVSRYHHLDTISVPDGTLVTPGTQIGTMGHSGDFAPCTTNYLHFEVRTGGVTGTRINPGQLKACVDGRQLSYPAAWGYSSWDSLVNAAETTPAADTTCLPDGAATPSAVPTTTTSRGDARVTVRWTPPQQGTVGRYLVYQELWSPSLSRWGTPMIHEAGPDQSSLTVTGLTNGRSYRYRVFARNAVGVAAAGPTSAAIPAGVPEAPRAPRWLTASPTIVRYAWWKAQHRGTPVTGYRLALRRWTASGWTAYTVRDVGPDVLSWKWSTMRPGTRYQMRVRALSAVGASAWSPSSTVSTPRA